MAKYDRVGTVWKKRGRAWPAVIGVVLFIVVLGAIFG